MGGGQSTPARVSMNSGGVLWRRFRDTSRPLAPIHEVLLLHGKVTNWGTVAGGGTGGSGWVQSRRRSLLSRGDAGGLWARLGRVANTWQGCDHNRGFGPGKEAYF